LIKDFFPTQSNPLEHNQKNIKQFQSASHIDTNETQGVLDQVLLERTRIQNLEPKVKDHVDTLSKKFEKNAKAKAKVEVGNQRKDAKMRNGAKEKPL
jgi:wobble nucleotide-excising tRNase